MERHELLEMMRELQLSGMKAAYDEVLREALRCGHAIQRILGDLLKAELAEKRARSIRYRLAAAKLPLVKELAEFDFKASPVNAALVRDLHAGGLLTPPRNAVLVGGTGTGKSHLALCIAVNCIRGGARARFFNVVDLVNQLEAEVRAGQAGKLAGQLARVDRTHPPRGAYRAWVKPAFDLTGVLSSAGTDWRRNAQWRSSPG